MHFQNTYYTKHIKLNLHLVFVTVYLKLVQKSYVEIRIIYIIVIGVGYFNNFFMAFSFQLKILPLYYPLL